MDLNITRMIASERRLPVSKGPITRCTLLGNVVRKPILVLCFKHFFVTVVPLKFDTTWLEGNFWLHLWERTDHKYFCSIQKFLKCKHSISERMHGKKYCAIHNGQKSKTRKSANLHVFHSACHSHALKLWQATTNYKAYSFQVILPKKSQ